MKIEYDAEANALYIQIREARVDDNIDIEILDATITIQRSHD